MTSGSITVDGNHIWYEKFGTGSHAILLYPGAIGTGRTDFGPQIEGPNALNPMKYTLIALEPLGWGRSRPPVRKYSSNIYNNDVYCGYKIMEALGYTSYSVMGWSDGAKTAIIMAAKYPSRVMSCVVWGVIGYSSPKSVKSVAITKNIRFWGQDLMDNYLKVYGQEWTNLWNRHIEFLEKVDYFFPNWSIIEYARKIQSPVFVLHGDQDPIVELEHSVFVAKQASDSQLHRFPKGSHNLHITYAMEFKRLVETFLEEVDNGY
ncbi:valacyclovir hydrolase-like [Oppia nitens]|uniref:valacyclovir hydrolase-like n=1 Tax=Oppia nitens TaxID=1686743 RepID=UPI0023DA02D6|nr:valacyclovir hydrolase-like [Oppia nitens]